MSDISAPALEKALAKVNQLVPTAKRIETVVRTYPCSAECRCWADRNTDM
jgi:hypothetical protein